MESTSELPPEVIAALKAGRKLDAMRLLRAQQGVGLKQARELLDHAADMQTPGDAEMRPLKPDNGIGQLIKVAIALGILFVFVRILLDQ
jgi:hypothetical protein